MECPPELKKLYASIGKLITSSLELDGIIAGIMEEVALFFNPENWSLLRFDHTSKYLYFLYARGINIDRVKYVRIKPGEGIAGTVALTAESIFVPDTAKDERFSSKIDEITGFKTNSIIAVPLIFRGTVYGVIELINRKEGGYFTEDEHLLLNTIADFAAIALANSTIFDELKHMSTTDALTGVYNRSKFDIIKEEYRRTFHHRREDDKRHNFITLVYLDLDQFKQINDTEGHAKGDSILKEFTKGLKKIIRQEDMIFRMGGDEFLILSSYTNEEYYKTVESRFSSLLENISQIKYSYGIASGPTNEIDALLVQADKKMYHSKKNS